MKKDCKTYREKQQHIQTWKDWMTHTFKNNNRCPICYININPLWSEQALKNQKQCKEFYQGYCNTVKCSNSNCQTIVHEYCLGKIKKKKKNHKTSYKCHFCEEKEQKEEKCIICQNKWGMKKKVQIGKNKKYAHLICLYFSPDFYCSNFASHQYLPLNDKYVTDDPFLGFQKCIVCDNSINILSDNLLNCFCCDKVAHLNCGLYLESQCYQSFENHLNVNLNIIKDMPLIVLLDQFQLKMIEGNESSEISPNTPNCLSEVINNSESLKMIQNKDIQKVLMSNTQFLMKSKRQQVIFQMACKDHLKYKNKYCCHKFDKEVQDEDWNLYQCEICLDWVHQSCLKGECTNGEDLSVAFYICNKCQEFNSFLISGKNYNSLFSQNKYPLTFFHYLIMSIYLEQKNQREETGFIAIDYFCKYNSFDIRYRVEEKIEEMQKQQEKDYFRNQLKMFFEENEPTNIMIEKFIVIYDNFQNNFQNHINQDGENNKEVEKEYRILSFIFEETKNMINNPTIQVYEKIKQGLKRFFHHNKYLNYRNFLVQYFEFLTRTICQPLSDFVKNLEEFFVQESQEYIKAYHQEFKPLLNCESKQYGIKDLEKMKKLNNSKISYEKFYSFMSEYSNNPIFENYIQSHLNLDNEFFSILQKDFKDLSVKQIHKLQKHIVSYSLRLPNSIMDRIDAFLSEFPKFLQSEQEFIKINQRIENIENFGNGKMREFLEDEKNIRTLITIDEIKKLQDEVMVDQLSAYYFDKFNSTTLPSSDEEILFTQCMNHYGSIRKYVKQFLKKLFQNLRPISEKALQYILECGKEYKFRKLLESETTTLEHFEEVFFQLDSEKTNIFIYQKGLKKIQELKSFTQKQQEFFSDFDLNIIDDFTQLVEDAKKEMSDRRLKLEVIQNYFNNVRFAQEANYLLDQNIELAGCTIKNLKYQEIFEKLNKEVKMSQLKKLVEIPLQLFVTDEMKSLYNKVKDIYYSKLFSEDTHQQINPTIFQDNQLLQDITNLPQVKNSFDKKQKQYQNYQEYKKMFLQQTLEVEDYHTQQQQKFDLCEKILELSDNFQIEDIKEQQFLQFINKVRISSKILILIKQFITLTQIEQKQARQIFEENKDIYLDIKNILKEKIQKNDKVLGLTNYDIVCKFLDEYEKYEQCKVVHQEYQKRIKQIQKKNYNEYKYDKVELLKIQWLLQKYQFIFIDSITEINIQLEKLQAEEHKFEKLNDEIFNNDLEYAKKHQIKIDQRIQSSTELFCLSQNILNCQQFYTLLLDLLGSFEKPKQEWDFHFEKIQSIYQNEQKPLFIHIQQLNNTFKEISEKLIQIQEFDEDQAFANYVQSIHSLIFKDEGKFVICFNYESMKEFQHEIQVCLQLITEDYHLFFQEFYNENELQRVGKIAIPEHIREQIKKKLELVKVITNYIAIQKESFDDLMKLNIFLIIKKEFGGYLEIFANESIKELYIKIQFERREFEELHHLLMTSIVKISEVIQSYYLQENHHVSSSTNIIDSEGILRLQKLHFLLENEKISVQVFVWVQNFLQKVMSLLQLNSSKFSLKYLFQTDYQEMLCSLKRTLQETKDFKKTRFLLESLLRWVFIYLENEEIEEIIKSWKFSKSNLTDLNLQIGENSWTNNQKENLLDQIKDVIVEQQYIFQREQQYQIDWFEQILQGKPLVNSKEKNSYKRIFQLIVKIFSIPSFQEHEMMQKFTEFFIPEFEQYINSNEKKDNKIKRKICKFLKSIKSQPKKQNLISSKNFSFNSILTLIQEKADLNDSINKEEQIEDIYLNKRNFSAHKNHDDSDIWTVYDNLTHNKNTKQIQEQNKKIHQQLQSRNIDAFNFQSLIQQDNYNLMYAITPKKVFLHDEQLYNINFITRNIQIQFMDAMHDLYFKNDRDKSVDMQYLQDSLLKTENRQYDWDKMLLGWIKVQDLKTNENQLNGYKIFEYFNKRLKHNQFLKTPQVFNQKTKILLIARYLELPSLFHQRIDYLPTNQNEIVDFEKLFIFIIVDKEFVKKQKLLYSEVELQQKNITVLKWNDSDEMKMINPGFILTGSESPVDPEYFLC